MPTHRQPGVNLTANPTLTPATINVGKRPGIGQLPFTVALGASWMILVDAPRRIELGHMTLSGALTILVATLTLLCLPGYVNSSTDLRSTLSNNEWARTRIPWLLWIFVFYSLASFLITGHTKGFSSESIQNFSVLLAFVGSVAFAGTIQSDVIVERGWNLLRSVSTWFAYLALGASALAHMGGLIDGRLHAYLFNPRALAIVSLIALAIVIPGTPRNRWMQYAPFVIVAALAISLSRASTVIGLALLVFLVLRSRQAKRGELGGRTFKLLFMLIGVALIGYLLLLYYAPFRERFLNDHDTVSFGGVAIATEGRATVWSLILSKVDNWQFGQGAGAASVLVNERFPGVLDHPHNEYLRFYFDYGALGLALFVGGYLVLTWRNFSNARRTDGSVHWAAFLGLISTALVAITDNPFVYPFVMVPLGSLVGLSLARSRFELVKGHAIHQPVIQTARSADYSAKLS